MKKGILAVLCCTALLCGCSDSSSSSVKETIASTETETEAATSSAKYKQLTLDEVKSKAEVRNHEDGSIDIKGNFVDFRIEDKDDAFKALASISDIIGCKDIDNEIRFYKSKWSPQGVGYSFHQYYKGIRTNSEIIVYVGNENKELELLTCAYYPEFQFDLTPTFTLEQVKEYLALKPEERDCKYIWDKYEEPELIISFFEGDVRLGWMIRFIDGETSYLVLDAHTGEFIFGSYPEDF